MVVQRLIEFIRGVPNLPLWMALSAAIPPFWGPIKVYFAITVVLSFIGWTGMARVVRGRFLALREEDFVMAARLVGSSNLRIILRHLPGGNARGNRIGQIIRGRQPDTRPVDLPGVIGQSGFKKTGKRVRAVSRPLDGGIPPFQEVFRKGVTGQIVSNRHPIFAHHSALRDISTHENCNIHSKHRYSSVSLVNCRKT